VYRTKHLSLTYREQTDRDRQRDQDMVARSPFCKNTYISHKHTHKRGSHNLPPSSLKVPLCLSPTVLSANTHTHTNTHTSRLRQHTPTALRHHSLRQPVNPRVPLLAVHELCHRSQRGLAACTHAAGWSARGRGG